MGWQVWDQLSLAFLPRVWRLALVRRILREAFRANYNDFGGSTCTTFTHRFGGFSSHDLTNHPGQGDALLLVPSLA